MKNKKIKAISIIIYGIIFLISTLAFYLVNTSKAKNVLKVQVSVLDKEENVDIVSYEIKVPEEKEGYTAKLSPIQNGIIVKKYKMVSEEEFNIAKEKFEEKKAKEKAEQEKKEAENKKTEENKDEENKEEKKDEELEKEENKKEDNNNTEEKNNNENAKKEESNIIQKESGEEAKEQEKQEEKTENNKTENKKEEKKETKEENKKEENDQEEKKSKKEENETKKEQKETPKEEKEIKKEEKTANKKEEKEIKKESKENKKEEKDDEKKEENTEEEEEREQYIEGTKDIILSEEQVESKKIYFIAEYDYEEVKDQKVYNKMLLSATKQNDIRIKGYMPENAEISVKEEEISKVEEMLKKNFQDVKKEIKLVAAYDIKILSEDKEYEPKDFDKDASVSISGFDRKKYNVWHIIDEDTIEMIEPNMQDNKITFETEGFSIYGIEEAPEENNTNKEQETNTNAASNTVDENKTDENTQAGDNKAKAPPLKAAPRATGDSTLEIDDYNSDYYYYKGKNYTDNIAGTNSNEYTDSNLVKVTLYYNGFAQGETDNEKKGRISYSETHDIIKNIRCAPVKNGRVTLELMENPFMDKPTGYGFAGWNASSGTVSQDTNTLTYTLTVNTSSDVTINLYAKWEAATVVYVNSADGNDNLNDGLSENAPFGSWGKAFEYINSHNKGNREKNIIVVTGDMDSSINYTRPITKTVTKPVISVTYSSSTTLTTGTEIILANGQGAGSRALAVENGSLSAPQLTTNPPPSDNTKWIITSYNNGYSLMNVGTGQYLVSSSNGTLSLQSTPGEFRYYNRRFYYYGRRYDYYIRYNNGWTTSTNQNNGLQFYFLTANPDQIDPNGEDIIRIYRGSLETNTYYRSSSASVPVTVTSLYNHTDYRDNAIIDLTTANYDDFEIFKDFQMNHVKIDATGYTSNSDGTTFSGTYPFLFGYLNNVRLGRGIICADTSSSACTFANVIGGEESATTSTLAYKLIVESGKYSSIQGFNRNGQTYSYYGTVYLTLGNDIDRKAVNNSNLKVYYRTTINSGGGMNGTNTNEKAWLINVKSGSFGTDFFDNNSGDEDIAYAGIYMGGYGTGATNNIRDRSDRYMIVEGGLIANAIGGLKVTNNSGVETRLYVKGGEIYNIVGGAGVSTTYEDRIIQVTGGKIRYSVNGGSNGVYATGSGQDGRITNCDTLVYIGGTAQIGTSETLSNTLYGVDAGCVLGAGNGNASVANSGSVNTTHIIINDSAHILKNVYGGGNYGIVGSSGSTTGITKIEILGGTVDGSVYGGANRNNIYGSTAIDMKGGQVIGAIYGGSNVSGTISTTTTINVTGGTLGRSSNTTDNEILFGGGYGSSTVVAGNAIVNIKDTDGNVIMYGSAYGGSSQGSMSGNVTVNIQDLPSVQNTISITGNVFAGGKGTASNAATISGNAIINVDGSNLPNASIFGGNDVNGTTNGNINVNIGQNYSSKLLNAYGGGNLDATGTEADQVYVRLYTHADVTNAFNGGKSADLTTGGNTDTTRAIYLQGGKATNIFGGSDTLGTVTASHVYIQSGQATNVYGGNNEGGQTSQSFVYITGGTTENVYGGGYKATTPITNVSLTGGTITNGFGGGNAANVTTANITLAGTVSANIYGGSNSSGTVTQSNVAINSGTVTNVYGGNNAGGNTVNTNVNISSTAVNVYGGGNEAQTSGNTNVVVNSQVTNVYGGGNQAITSGNTNVRLTNATVTGDAYGGGNGVAAVVVGNSTTLVEGTTSIAGDLFGGGNAAANGTQVNNNSLVTTLITGGNIAGDVYGAANTSVVNGNTVVKIGTNVVNNNTMTTGSITIGGTVFGGGKSNTAGSEVYDFTFESVTGNANIDIDATGYDNGTYTYTIGKSIFGSGNAAKISGYGIVNIKNYGSANNIKSNVSIQRASQVTLDNCHIFLEGTTDTTNEIATAVYTFNRVDDLILKNNTVLYLASGANIVSKFQSQTSTGAKESVQIGANGITSQNVNNRIYLAQGRNFVLKTEAGTDGEVYGMAFVGIYKGTTTREFGIYGNNYTHGSTVTTQVAQTFTRNSYVQGKHYSSHNIQVDGFYTNFNNEGTVKVDYINPTPDDATYYQWIIGEKSTDIYYEDIELIATKYATTATYVLNLNGLSYPNMTINVKGINVSDLSQNIDLIDPDDIPNIAPTATQADSNFGLTMTAGNTGWQTKGTTYFLNNDDVQAGVGGRTQYLSDNSTTTPTFSLYLAHSKNIATTANLGNVTINLEAIYEENEEIKIKNVYIVLKLTTNNSMQGNDYYEGAITPGKEYRIFPSTTTTITQNSSFSAYYSLYIDRYTTTNYYDGFVGHYYHSFESSCVLPANTKITLIDMSGSTIKYYYYIVSSNDYSTNKKVYRFTDFYCMDSEDEHYSADGSYYNSTTDLLYEEFIIHVDFEDTTLTTNLTSKNILVQLRDVYDDTVALTVNTAAYPMLFSVYNEIDVNKRLSLRTDKTVIYMGASLNLNIETEYSFNKNENSDIVYETTHIEDQLGIRIYLSSGSDILTAAQLEGIYITYKGANYFPRSDGSYRIKIADAVSNVLADMVLNTENGSLDTGTYTIHAQSFGSIDGTYFSSEIASDTKDIQVVSTDYGFSVQLDDNSALIDKNTGKTKNNTNNLNFTLGYSGGFEHPRIVVSMYRRKYDQIISYEYELVDLKNYVDTTLTSTYVEKEYLVTDLIISSQNFALTLKNNGLTTGTYKIVFTLYDGNNKICDMDKPIIIK